jgi:hypothetical protein
MSHTLKVLLETMENDHDSFGYMEIGALRRGDREARAGWREDSPGAVRKSLHVKRRAARAQARHEKKA